MNSRQYCLNALREAAKILEETPSKEQYETLGLKPGARTIQRKMGGWNAAKEAAGLELLSYGDRNEKPISPKPADIEIPEGETWESLSPQQRWYYQNREHRIAVKERRRKQFQRWIYEFKRDRCRCNRRGESASATLDFHHTSQKRANVSKLVNAGYGVDRLKEEISKCEVLCANCHHKEHHPLGNRSTDLDQVEFPTQEGNEELVFRAKRRRRAELRQWVFVYTVRSGGCQVCGEEDPRCLEFHHENPDEKGNTIGQMIVYQPTISDLMGEIEKCTILCRNCHRKHHHDPPEDPEE